MSFKKVIIILIALMILTPSFAFAAESDLEDYSNNHGETLGKGYEYFFNNPSFVVSQFKENVERDIEKERNNQKKTRPLN